MAELVAQPAPPQTRIFGFALPSTKAILAWVGPYTVLAVAWAATRYHWTDTQKLDVGGLVVAALALLGFVIEHLRRETVSRWVGVIGLVPAFLVAGYAVAASFAWFGVDVSTVSGVSGWIYSVFTPIGSLVGVVIVQAKVYSPETNAKELEETATTVAAAKAVDPIANAR